MSDITNSNSTSLPVLVPVSHHNRTPHRSTQNLSAPPTSSPTSAAVMDSTITTASPPIFRIPQDTLHLVFSHTSLRDITISKSVCRLFNSTLSSSSFTDLISTLPPPLPFLALRPPHRHASPQQPTLHVFDPDNNRWLKFPLSFLPFRSHQPVASSHGLIYLWADSSDSNKSLIVCNPLTRSHRVLPQLGSAWSRHGSVLVGPPNRVLVLTELAVLYFCNTTSTWLKFSSNLPSKPRSPILVSDSVLALCDVGSPWRNQWKLFSCTLQALQTSQQSSWTALSKPEWGDVFDILKRPRLVKGTGNTILMIGGLKSSFTLNASCSTILILRLDLETLEWGEAGRMPGEMFRFFQESSKFKVFGSGIRVCFSAKRMGRLALWDFSGEKGGEWRWIDAVPGNGDGLYRGFLFDARLNALP